MKLRLLLTVCGLLCASSLAQAQLYFFDINLDGSQEVPGKVTTGWGTGTASLDWATFEFEIDFTFTGLIAPTTAAHVHKAPIGVNGPVIIPISTLPVGVTSGSVSYTTTLTELVALELINENSYLNIHSQVYPGGEIRGQLVLSAAVPEPSTYALAATVALLAAIGVRRLRRTRPQPPRS